LFTLKRDVALDYKPGFIAAIRVSVGIRCRGHGDQAIIVDRSQKSEIRLSTTKMFPSIVMEFPAPVRSKKKYRLAASLNYSAFEPETGIWTARSSD
jgi:hypothetical protein